MALEMKPVDEAWNRTPRTWKDIPPDCPINDGAYCPHRKVENLVYLLLAIMLLNDIGLLILTLWNAGK